MLLIDPESLYTFAQDISIGFQKPKTPEKHKATDYEARETLDTIPSNDEIHEEEIQMLKPDARFQFFKRTLLITSLHLCLILGMTYLLCVFQNSFPDFVRLSREDDTGLAYMFYWSVVISFCLFLIPPLANIPVLNFILLELDSLLIADYMAVKGFAIPLYPEIVSTAVCLCCPFQILCLSLYAHFKKNSIGLMDFLPLSGMSIMASLFLVILFGNQSNISQWTCITVISFIAQSGFVLFTNFVKNRDKAELNFGDHIQAMMSLYMSIYTVLGILALLALMA